MTLAVLEATFQTTLTTGPCWHHTGYTHTAEGTWDYQEDRSIIMAVKVVQLQCVCVPARAPRGFNQREEIHILHWLCMCPRCSEGLDTHLELWYVHIVPPYFRLQGSNCHIGAPIIRWLWECLCSLDGMGSRDEHIPWTSDCGSLMHWLWEFFDCIVRAGILGNRGQEKIRKTFKCREFLESILSKFSY